MTGEAQFFGNTLCKNKNCEQCQPYRKDGDFRWEQVPDRQFQEQLKQHKKFMQENYFLIEGDIPIKKRMVSDMLIAKMTADKIKSVRYAEGASERLTSTRLNKSYLEALDTLEFTEKALYNEFSVDRDEDYPIGSREWRLKLEVASIMDIIKATANYSDEMKELIRECKNTSSSDALSVERVYEMIERDAQMEMEHKSIAKIANEIERPRPAKVTKKTIKIGKYDVPKHLIEDYVNSVKMSNTSAIIFKAKYGTLDPLVEQKKFQARVELHEKIFVALKLPYHQKIDHRKKLTKQDEASIEFQSALSEYMEKDDSI